VSYYERNLPHWHPDGAAIFLTWRLHGSYDKFRVYKMSTELGIRFAELDREFDRAPSWADLAQNSRDRALRARGPHLWGKAAEALCALGLLHHAEPRTQSDLAESTSGSDNQIDQGIHSSSS
jgi:hypothetical protein